MGNLFSNTNTNTNLNKKKYSSDKNIKSNKIITEDKNFQIKQIHQKNTIQIISKEPFVFDYKKTCSIATNYGYCTVIASMIYIFLLKMAKRTHTRK